MAQDETDELEQLMRRGHEAGLGERYVESHDFWLRALQLAEVRAERPSRRVTILRALAHNAYQLGNLEEARGHCMQALALGESEYGPRSGRLALTLVLLITILIFMGQPEEAIPFAERHVEIDSQDPSRPRRPWAHLYLGRCLMLAGRADEAIDHLEMAMKIILHVKPNADTTITRELQSWILDARAQRRGT